MERGREDRVEIDLLELLFAFRRRILWIVLAAIL